VIGLHDITRENPASNPIGWTRSHRRQSDCCRAVRGRSDADLAGPRCEDMSYFFAGRPELDLPLALDILDRELGVKRLLFGGRRAVPTVPFCGPD